MVHTSVDETQSFVRWMEVENLSEESWSISRIAVYNGVLDNVRKKLPYPGDLLGDDRVAQEEYFSVGYFRDGGWGREGDFGWHRLHTDTTVIDMRYTCSKFRHPLIFVRDHVLGRIWYWQLAWTAGCEFRLDHCQGYAEAQDSMVSLTAELASHNPMLVLRGRETYALPEIHFGVIQGDLDDAVNCMHAHTRNITLPEADPSSCLVIGSMGASCDMSVETTREHIRHFAEMGAEIFMIDAGWQCPPGKQGEHRKYNGTNIAAPDRYPNGMAEIADDCHAHGMKFGLWTEIERIGEYSPVYRRTDLGIMKYFNHTWVSDNQIMPRSVLIANGMTIALPPERVDRMFAGMMGPGQKYRVTLDNSRASFVMDGRELPMGGLVLDISASMSSELVLYEVIDN